MGKLTLFLVAIVSMILFCGCTSPHMALRNGKDWIPADFDPKNCILMIESHNPMDRDEQKMKAYMEKKYPYRYVFATLADINGGNAMYGDPTLYRWALIEDRYTIQSVVHHGAEGYDFKFYDRANQKKYPPTNKGSHWKNIVFSPLINTLVKRSK